MNVSALTQTFTGNGSTTAFTVTDKPEKLIGVTVDGIATTDYSYDKSSGVITFNTAPANNKAIVVTY